MKKHASPRRVSPGRADPLGATLREGGVNFSLYSRPAQRVELLLFDGVEAAQPSRVIALESDPWATAAARENARANGVEDKVDVRDAAVGPGDLASLGPFDGVVANIEARVLVPLLAEFRLALVPRGWLVLSGILTSEAAGVVQEALRQGLSLTRVDAEGEWWTGTFAPTALAS